MDGLAQRRPASGARVVWPDPSIHAELLLRARGRRHPDGRPTGHRRGLEFIVQERHVETL